MTQMSDRIYEYARVLGLTISPLLFSSRLSRQIVKFVARKAGSQVASLMALIRPGDVIVDVGANTGGYTILFGHLVGRTGFVHVFEPVPDTFIVLESNIKKARLTARTRLNNCAVGNRLGTTQIYLPGEDRTEAALVRHEFASWASSKITSFVCKLVTLDDYVSRNKVARIDFVKIDVEGAELLVLQGMKAILSSSNPPILMLELFPTWMKDFGYSLEDLFGFLRSLDYEVYFMGNDGLIHCQSANEASSMLSFPRYLDFICIKPRIHIQMVLPVIKVP